MSNETQTTKVVISDSDEELLRGLYYINENVSPACRQAATLCLSGFFVVGLLLIIPALMQTAAAYVWSAQIRRESSGHIHHLTTATPSSKKGQPYSKRRLPVQDRTLFLYRILACGASLLVLILSTLPQLVIAVAKPQAQNSIDKRWGWCHSIIYADHVTRCFASYLVVVPFGLLFWNFVFSEVIPRHNLLMQNVFGFILKSSLIIAICSLIFPIPIVVQQYTKSCGGEYCLCAISGGFTKFIYYDFVSTRICPAICVIVIGAGFLRWLPRNDYGVFYEPAIFLAFMTPHMLCESLIHIFHQAGALYKLSNDKVFSNFMLLAYAAYHMSFSCTFVQATFRSMLGEIREERRKRSLFLLGENPDIKVESPSQQLHGTKRRTNLIEGLQKQFSVAYRWKPDFTDEETGVIAGQTDGISLQQSIKESSTDYNDLDGQQVNREYSKQMQNPNDTGDDDEQEAVDDTILHYAILQHSASLKRKDKEKQTQRHSPMKAYNMKARNYR